MSNRVLGWAIVASGVAWLVLLVILIDTVAHGWTF